MDDKARQRYLVGLRTHKPLVELFQQRMNFVLEYGPEVDDSVVTNRDPSAGEDAAYKNAWAENSHRTYAVLAFVPSMDNRGKSLLIEGLTMAGTQAAADFVFNESTMEPVLRKAKDASGTIAPFELLLETNSIGSSAPGSRIIAARYSSEAR